MRIPLAASIVLFALAGCGSSDDDADPVEDTPSADAPAGSDHTGSEPADVGTAASTPDASSDTSVEEPVEEPADEPPADTPAPGPGDATGTLTGPALDILVVGRCDYDAGDLTSADIAFADVRGVDPDGKEWPVRFGLSGSDTRNTQLNVDGTQVVVRWPAPGLLQQSTDDGSYLLDTTIGRLVVTTTGGYELNISCFER